MSKYVLQRNGMITVGTSNYPVLNVQTYSKFISVDQYGMGWQRYEQCTMGIISVYAANIIFMEMMRKFRRNMDL